MFNYKDRLLYRQFLARDLQGEERYYKDSKLLLLSPP
jgi:hypothetical protein